jgi:hypothetical protein
MSITAEKNYDFIDILIADFIEDNCTLEKKIKILEEKNEILEKQLSLLQTKVIVDKQNINDSYWNIIKQEFTTTFYNR